jgi:hypothetical protein
MKLAAFARDFTAAAFQSTAPDGSRTPRRGGFDTACAISMAEDALAWSGPDPGLAALQTVDTVVHHSGAGPLLRTGMRLALLWAHPASMVFAVVRMLSDRPEGPAATPGTVMRDAALDKVLGVIFGA